MAEVEVCIDVEIRDQLGKGANKKLRRTGKVPGIVYGHSHESVAIAADLIALRAASRSSRFFNIKLPSGETLTVVLKDVQRNHLGMEVLHVDLQNVRMDEEILATVPLEFAGEFDDSEGAALAHEVTEIEIHCIANRIPETIVVDLSKLDMHTPITAGDLVLPQGARLETNEETVVARLYMPHMEEEETTEDVDPAAVPVVGKEDKDEE